MKSYSSWLSILELFSDTSNYLLSAFGLTISKLSWTNFVGELNCFFKGDVFADFDWSNWFVVITPIWSWFLLILPPSIFFYFIEFNWCKVILISTIKINFIIPWIKLKMFTNTYYNADLGSVDEENNNLFNYMDYSGDGGVESSEQ